MVCLGIYYYWGELWTLQSEMKLKHLLFWTTILGLTKFRAAVGKKSLSCFNNHYGSMTPSSGPEKLFWPCENRMKDWGRSKGAITWVIIKYKTQVQKQVVKLDTNSGFSYFSVSHYLFGPWFDPGHFLKYFLEDLVLYIKCSRWLSLCEFSSNLRL